MGFQWDPVKDASNQARHRIGFRQAVQIFRGFIICANDRRRDYGEDREIALGEYDGEIIHVGLHPPQRGHPDHLRMEGESE